MTPAEKHYTPQEVADLFKVTRQAVYLWIKHGKILSVKIGAAIRIPESEVERMARKGLDK